MHRHVLQIVVFVRQEGIQMKKMKKFIVEFGLGTDLHGQNVTKAACKAVKDAVSRSCLCGLQEILGIADADFPRRVYIQCTVGVSRPEEVDLEAVASMLPVGTAEVKAVPGGLVADGVCIRNFGDKEKSVEAAVAGVEVFIRE